VSETSGFARPFVVSWNLNLPLQPPWPSTAISTPADASVGTENVADRSELGTEECFRVIDEIAVSRLNA